MLRDPRVEALNIWAREGTGSLSETADAGLAALLGSLPRPETAPAIAHAVAAAYARVPASEPRDVRAGNAMVALLEELGEPGASELIRLRDTVLYKSARHTVEKALARTEMAVGTPLGELADLFAGVNLDEDLRTHIGVGGHQAIIGVTPDLRRVQTTWLHESGRLSSQRPSRIAEYEDELLAVEDVRRQLRAHVTAVRKRFEAAMVEGRAATASDWTGRMFSDPLRSAMTRRLIWRVESDRAGLVLPTAEGLRNIHGASVAISPRDNVVLWHPADDPGVQQGWSDVLDRLGIAQPIAQAQREIVLADPNSPRLAVVAGSRVSQTPFRGVPPHPRLGHPLHGTMALHPRGHARNHPTRTDCRSGGRP